jgi:hypothetical protein
MARLVERNVRCYVACSVRVLRASVRPFLSSFLNFSSHKFPNLGAKIAKS